MFERALWDGKTIRNEEGWKGSERKTFKIQHDKYKRFPRPAKCFQCTIRFCILITRELGTKTIQYYHNRQCMDILNLRNEWE